MVAVVCYVVLVLLGRTWWRWVLKKLIVAQLAQKFQEFYGIPCPLPCTQDPVTCPHPFPTVPYYSSNIHPNIILPSTSTYSKWSLSFRFAYQNSKYIDLFRIKISSRRRTNLTAVFVVFLRSSRQISWYYLKLGHDNFFQIYYSLIIKQFNAIYYEEPRALLNKQRTNKCYVHMTFECWLSFRPQVITGNVFYFMRLLWHAQFLSL
jgi:hypothetical protein